MDSSTMISHCSNAMVDYNQAGSNKRRAQHPDMNHPNQRPMVNTNIAQYAHPSTKPSCSSQQEHGDKENNISFYDMKAPIDYKLRLCELSPKETPCQQQKEDWIEKFKNLKLDIEKSPIAKLNEIMLSKKQVMQYNLVSIAGRVHDPIFTFEAKNNGIVAFGEGSSKREAKKNAAIAFLKKLEYIDNGNNTISSTTSNISPNVSLSPFKYSEDSILEVKSELNPIGVLQELCMARRWELPNYGIPRNEHNEESNPWYSLVCSLKEFKSTGEGRTKQAAKRNAARLVYDQIKNVQINDKTKDIEYPMSGKYILTNSTERINSCSLYCMQSIEALLNQLKLSKKPCLSKLKNDNFKSEIRTDAIEFLDAIGNEENFSISYVLMSKKSFDIGMLVQLTIAPLLLFVGTGATVKEAQEMAAYGALLYIKLLMEK